MNLATINTNVSGTDIVVIVLVVLLIIFLAKRI